ncbi:hypothetical protein HYPSUDRAFT_209335 [Hypholoma sublateritium FD-334 SS-4]|uniref:Uncharacterized protein n=1 Tax=Hypholoma sublateritium (strain FD-334 SS-4) TaxID=945553 RepID=A0A0D2LSD8_HYPSF|nr:hypothetical protein HYPSUDRAFT_209335 [Hypholoma sublateritium FD-334 SS-4]
MVWKAKFETLQYVFDGARIPPHPSESFIRTAYNSLLNRVPALPEAERQQLDQKDYPLIEYWYKHQWTTLSVDRITNITGKAENENEDEDVGVDMEGEGEELRSTSPAPSAQRGQGRSRAGINVSMRYIQDKHGQVIDGHRAREIRMHARALFVGFAMQGRQFSSWGDADAISRRTFYNEMVKRFEELQYCDLDWKAEQIATDSFPGWKVTWLKKQKKSLEQLGTKRARQRSVDVESDPKRPKNVEITTMSPTPLLEASSAMRQLRKQPVPIVNIIPNTPVRLPPAAENSNLRLELEQRQFRHNSFLQPSKSYDFSINNPLDNDAFTAGQFIPAVPASDIGLQPPQAFETRGVPSQLVLGDRSMALRADPPAPAKRSRSGTTKMRPSKTSTTPRNLCALEWTISNPKGTTDEFSSYYDSLSAEAKTKWEKLSVEAKEPGKSAA